MNKLLASVFALVLGSSAAHAQFNEFGPFNLPWGGNGAASGITASSTTTFTNKTINCANNTCTVRLGSDVTGTLPYGNGGTGATAFTNHGAVTAGASALTTVAPGTSGNIFTSNGTDWTSAAPATNGTVTSLTLSPGFTKTVGTQNTGSDAITSTGTLNAQLWPVNKAVSYTVATADTGVLLTATAGSVVFTLPNPASGTKGTTYQFASDGTNGYSLTTVGGTATVYGCFVTSGTTTAVIPNKVDTMVVDDGTNYKCTSVSGVAAITQVTGLGTNVATALATPTSANWAAALTDETGSGAAVFAVSPALTGTPTVPTATVGTNTTQAASTAFVIANAGSGGGGILQYSDNGLTLTAGTRYVPIGGSGTPSTTEADYSTKAPSTMTINNLQVNISADPGGGQTLVTTLRKAGSDQTLTCTITGGAALSCQDVTHSISVAQNDLINWKVVTTGTFVATPSVTILANSGTTNNGITGSGTTNGLAYFSSSAAETSLAAATNGQIPIGSTSAAPVLAAITAGFGTTVTNGAGSITIASSATPTAAGTTHSLTGPREYWSCTGTCTVTPPVPVAGYEFCVFNDDNVATAITLAALGSSAMYENSARTAYGTAGTGTLVVSAAAANKICLLGRDSTHYWTISYNGTVTVN